jgi:hypothetical protein
LRLDHILAGSHKFLDAQWLFDLFEEQLDLPTILVWGCDSQSRQRHVVTQKDKGLSLARVVELDALQVLGTVLACTVPIERDGLMANKACGSVRKGRVKTPGVHIAFGSGHQKGDALVHGVKAREVQIALGLG